MNHYQLFAWLFKHELRLAWRKQKNDLGNFGSFFSPITLAITYILMHVIYVKSKISTVEVISFITDNHNTGWIFIISTIIFVAIALPLSFKALEDRSNLLLVYTSPLPPKMFIAVRLTIIMLQTAVLPIILISPIFNILAYEGNYQFLFGYCNFLCLSLYASIFTVSITLKTLELIDPSKVKLSGKLLFLISVGIIFNTSLIYASFFKLNIISFYNHFSEGLIFNLSVWAGKSLYGSLFQVFFIPSIGFLLLILFCYYFEFRFFKISIKKQNHLIPLKNKKVSKTNRSLREKFFYKEWKIILRTNKNSVELARQIFVIGIIITLTLSELKNSYTIALGSNILVICALLANDISWQIFDDAQPKIFLLSPTSSKTIINNKFYSATIPVICVLSILCLTLAFANIRNAIFTYVFGLITLLGSTFINHKVLQRRLNKSSPSKQGQTVILIQGFFILSLALLLFILLT